MDKDWKRVGESFPPEGKRLSVCRLNGRFESTDESRDNLGYFFHYEPVFATAFHSTVHSDEGSFEAWYWDMDVHGGAMSMINQNDFWKKAEYVTEEEVTKEKYFDYFVDQRGFPKRSKAILGEEKLHHGILPEGCKYLGDGF